VLNGFPAGTAPAERWRWLAREKLPEVEALIKQATDMKRMLQRGLRCECSRLEDCPSCQ
jgi:MerR family redox-sensitive transcriptional activator SoxR